MWKEEALLTVKEDASQGRVLFIPLKSEVYLMNTSVNQTLESSYVKCFESGRFKVIFFLYATVSCLTGASTGGIFHATHHATH